VFQSYDSIPRLTAREHVHSVTETSTDPVFSVEALDLIGPADRMDHFPARLTGSDQQRVAVTARKA